MFSSCCSKPVPLVERPYEKVEFEPDEVTESRMTWCVYRFQYANWSADIEPACLALAVGGVPFDERRISRIGKEWEDLKATIRCPYDQLPVLVIPTEESSGSFAVVAQSNAINRACARRAGMMPVEDPLRFAKIDEILCAIQDIRQKFTPSIMITDLEKKKAVRARVVDNILIPWLHHMEALLAKNISRFGQAFSVGPTLTIADLALDCLMLWLESGTLTGVDPQKLPSDGDLPLLTSVRRSVTAIPAVMKRRDAQPEIHRDEAEWSFQRVYSNDVKGKLKSSGATTSEDILSCFQTWDTTGSGLISVDMLEDVLARLDVFTAEEVGAVTKWADKDGEGKVKYKDFVDRLTKGMD